MNLVLKNIEGNDLGTVEFLSNFDVDSVNTTLIHESVVNYLANQRRGTASTKTRAEVSGGGKKPWKQKGTGRARVGSNRSPIWRGGGITFGPKPRDYSYKIPTKKKRKALVSALALKGNNQEILVLDEIKKISKTRQVGEALKNLAIRGKVLIIVEAQDNLLLKSTRNIPGVEFTYAKNLNIYEVISNDHILADNSSIEFLNKKFEEGK
ncbi:MAG: 50S ribosomal protein L4 [bacterium]|nr:50S ribosomal protein L4 [bacterium]